MLNALSFRNYLLVSFPILLEGRLINVDHCNVIWDSCCKEGFFHSRLSEKPVASADVTDLALSSKEKPVKPTRRPLVKNDERSCSIHRLAVVVPTAVSERVLPDEGMFFDYLAKLP